jgi:hypothetical protein
LTRWIAILLLLVAVPAWADTGGPLTAGTEDDTAGSCWTNDTSHAADDDTRVEASCTSVFRISNFGFTATEVPNDATVTGITVRMVAHGGAASQSVRRRLDVWVVDSAGNVCTSGGAPGRDNHQLDQGAEIDATWTGDDGASTVWSTCNGETPHTWTPSDVQDIDFGVEWKHTSSSGGNVVGIDLVEISVVYTPAGVGRRTATTISRNVRPVVHPRNPS